MKPKIVVGTLWRPKCNRKDRLSHGYSWWCDRCRVGGTQREVGQAFTEYHKRRLTEPYV